MYATLRIGLRLITGYMAALHNIPVSVTATLRFHSASLEVLTNGTTATLYSVMNVC